MILLSKGTYNITEFSMRIATTNEIIKNVFLFFFPKKFFFFMSVLEGITDTKYSHPFEYLNSYYFQLDISILIFYFYVDHHNKNYVHNFLIHKE
jgi:hypothetical protein